MVSPIEGREMKTYYTSGTPASTHILVCTSCASRDVAMGRTSFSWCLPGTPDVVARHCVIRVHNRRYMTIERGGGINTEQEGRAEDETSGARLSE